LRKEKLDESGGTEKNKLRRGSQDNTHNFIKLPARRRLDALAHLLAAQSECVAVAIINGQLYITANELHKNSKKIITILKLSLKSLFFFKIPKIIDGVLKKTSTVKKKRHLKVYVPTHD